jgi:hypothetical protein
VSFPVPPGPGSDVLLDPSAPVWRLCAAALSLTDADRRPPPAAWLPVLEQLLDDMGSPHAIGSVPAPAVPADVPWPGDIVVLPEPAPRRERAWEKVSPAMRYQRVVPPVVAAPIGYRTGTAPSAASPAGTPTRTELKNQMRRFRQWWLAAHRDLVRASDWPSRLRATLVCASVNVAILVAVASAAAAVMALLVSPVLGL